MDTRSTTSRADDDPQVEYGERYRPQFHYTPRRNWMNDPNGLVYHNGTYHLFHQYNPKGSVWGHMSWAHATSTDLIHWTEQPVALRAEDNEMVFSGSVVVDDQNQTGFGSPGGPAPLVAIYTSHYTNEGPEGSEAQSLAYSFDGGATWTKYEGNPVLEHPDPAFRDPNVFWYEPGSSWIMTVALPKQRTIQFYASDDLTEWTHLSDFGPAGSTEGIWECPTLVRVPVENEPDRETWVLQVDVDPGAVAGGSGAQYFVGSFDGTRFTPADDGLDAGPNWVDYGPDFYAAIPWNHLPEGTSRILWAGWMNNWQYADRLPTAPWRGALSVPREVGLRRIDGRLRLVQQPVPELEALRTDGVHVTDEPLSSNDREAVQTVTSGMALDVSATLELGTAESVGLRVLGGGDEGTTIGYDTTSERLFVDRSDSGRTDVHEAFPARHEAPMTCHDGTLDLRVLVDHSSVEVFANGGARVLSQLVFPNPESNEVSVFATGGTAHVRRLDVWPLRSIWSDR